MLASIIIQKNYSECEEQLKVTMILKYYFVFSLFFVIAIYVHYRLFHNLICIRTKPEVFVYFNSDFLKLFFFCCIDLIQGF